MNRRVGELLWALAFFTRYPARADPSTTLSGALWAAPLAGLCAAAPGAIVLALAPAIGPLPAAILAIASLIILTGALHEDGLADCADGFWGASEVGRRLAIMRDSRIGTYGVLALVLAIALKGAVLAELVAQSPVTAALAFIACAVIARAVGLYPAVSLPHARDDGLAVALGRPAPRHFRAALMVGLVVAVALLGFVAPIALLLALGAGLAASVAVAKLADAKIGGHTGDVVGAAIVLADLASLIVFTMWAGAASAR